MTAQDLKNAILQLAVQGKLVSQDPNDEPASELLKRIRSEKDMLIKEGTIKKEKPLAPISDDEIPFDIPESWKWVRLGEYCLSAFSGKSPIYEKVPTDYWVVGQAANQENGLDFSQIKYTTRDFWDSMEESFFLKENDVLLNTLGHGTLGRSGIVKGVEKKLLTDGHLFVFRHISEEASTFFWYFLQYRRPQIEKSANGSTNQTFLSLRKTCNWIVPIPPLTEQKRIVAKIEELMPLVEEYGKAEERLTALNTEFPDKLRKSILQQAIQGKLTERDPADEPASELLKRIRAEKERLIKKGKIKKEKLLPPITEEEVPFEIPEGWKWIRLSAIASFQGGYAYKSNTYVKESRNQLVRLGNVKNDNILFDVSPVFLPDSIAEGTADYRIKINDILFTMTGTKGKRDYFYTVVVKDKHLISKKLFLNQRVGCLRCLPSVNVDWLSFFLKSETVLDQIFATSTGNANQGNIGSENTMKLRIPLPPLAEQQRIVDRVNELLALCDELKMR